MEAKLFFDSWMGLGRVVIMAVCAYASLLFLLRITGKRTLSKMNAFDFVITVAIGSTLATVLLSKTVPLLEGVLAFALLILLQLTVTWLSIRWAKFKDIIKAEPTLLYYQGEFLESALRKERVVKEEVLQAVRNQGQADLQKVVSVVLETDGSFSIITDHASGPTSTLQNVLFPTGGQRPSAES